MIRSLIAIALILVGVSASMAIKPAYAEPDDGRAPEQNAPDYNRQPAQDALQNPPPQMAPVAPDNPQPAPDGQSNPGN